MKDHLRLALSLVAAPVAAVALLALPAEGVVTATWTVETYQQFDQGDATSAFITSTGEIRPGWDSKRTGVEGDAVWSALRLADGSVLIGSDAKGAVYRVANDATRKVLSIDGAIAVVALAQGPGGVVYAGTMPGAKLWKLDLAGGKATAATTLKDTETIWSLAVSGDTVYAGTGPSGKLFAVKGTAAREVFATEDKRITALTVTRDGAVWMGTSERAMVFRYDPKTNQARAMADFAGNEVSALAPHRDGVVAAANELADPPTGAGKTPGQVESAEKPAAAKGQAAKTPEVGTKPGADKETPAVADTGRRGAKKGKGALFHIGGDGRLEQLHALTQTYFTSIATTADDRIYAGAADKGRIYLVVISDGKNLWFATDDAAATYRVTGRANAAKYVSDVFDSKSVSRFGRVAWHSEGKVSFETRSGNTAKPGVGWSEWQRPGNVARQGGGVQSGKVTSPAGRYWQIRVSFEDEAAKVSRISSFYAPTNQATKIEDVTIEPASKESLPTLKDLAAKPRSPVLRIKWKIDNGDGDDTTYTLEARKDGEANWRPISTGKTPLTATTWEWNTETYPDGWYRLRVTASDAAANSPDRALTSSFSTPMFSIDNQRPVIEGLSINYPRATARASDAINVIAEASYSIDDGPWQLGASDDGLFDDLAEGLRIELPVGLAKGTHTLAVRVADAAGNVGSTSATFVVK
jgi:PQQ-like domain